MSWKVGYAEIDITPKDDYCFMSGFYKRRYAKGSINPLMAQCLAFWNQRNKPALILTADIIGFDRSFVESVKAKVLAKHKLPAQNIVLCASHTHWGPETKISTLSFPGGANIYYLDFLETSLLHLVDEALASFATAKLYFGETDLKLGCNRRLPDGKGGVTWGAYEDGPYDVHTPLIYAKCTNKSARYLFTTHACHPTSSGGVEKFTTDYPGHMRSEIQKIYGEHTKALFAMGCGADAKVTHLDKASGKQCFSASVKQAKAAGKRYANALAKIIDERDHVELPTAFKASNHEEGLPLQKAPKREELEKLSQSDDWMKWWARKWLNIEGIPRRDMPYVIQSWRFGNVLTYFSMEGEVCNPYGPMLREKAKTENAMVSAYTGAVQAYIPTRKIQKEGGYEGAEGAVVWGQPAPFTQGVEKKVMQIVQKVTG